MNRKFRQLTGLVLSALLIGAAAANDDTGCATQSAGQAQMQSQDWVQHTRLTLDSLKSELALAPAQTGAWDKWSAGVMADAKRQMAQKMERHEEREKRQQLKVDEKVDEKVEEKVDETTPQQMARGIARLREENRWMQKHIRQLQAAQVRTEAFYKSLSTGQKDSFDRFWRAMHHRMNGAQGCMTPDQGLHPE